MTGTTRLALPYVTSGQAQGEVPHNAALDQLDARLDKAQAVDLSGGNGSVDLAHLQACAIIIASGASVSRDLTLAAFAGERMVSNTGSHAINVKIGSTSISLPAGAWGFAIGDGTTNGLTLLVASFSGGTLTLATSMSGAAFNLAKAADIASASTTDLGAAAGNHADITGTATITALGTAQAGARRTVKFGGAATLTHDATALILPSGADIVTAAGDTAEFMSTSSGNWRCLWYSRASGAPIAGAAGNATQLQSRDIDSGAPADGDVLTWETASSKWKPKVTGAATGGLALIEQHTASGSGSLDFTSGLTSTYDDYEFRIVGLVPQTDNVDLLCLVSTDGGSTWESTNYGWSRNASQLESSVASGIASSASDSSILIWPTLPNAAARGLSGRFAFFDPLSTTMYKRMTGELFTYYNSAGLRQYHSVSSGRWEGTTAVNAVRFIMSSGNILKGTIRLYGLAK